MSGLSTRYVRTGAMNPAHQVPVAEMFRRQWGDVLPADEVLVLALEAGIEDARIEDGKVRAAYSLTNPAWGDLVLETAKQVASLAARRKRVAV